jgi:Flp pilus assembly protein CpaB
MRASTVFALALALLIGLAAAAGAKYAGLFEKKAAVEPEPAPAFKVLVAKVNLFEDMTVTSNQVMVKELPADELENLKVRLGSTWKEKLLPAMPTAAHLRVVNRNILADQILLKDHFAEAMLPDEISKRLEPNTRAVNVSVSKARAAGGILRVNEYVDVMLTTDIGFGESKELRTACVARGCKIIMKRNNPWTMMVADPDDKPLNFTLQANPYRAALIEYAGTHGQISLLPSPTPSKLPTGSFSDPSSSEYAIEDQRVEKINQGTLTIGDSDLMRIFNVTPPPPKPLLPPSTVIHHISGVKDAGYTVIPNGGAYHPATYPKEAGSSPKQPVRPAGGTSRSSTGSDVDNVSFSFSLPSATGNAGCKSCEELKKKATRQ